MRLRFDAICACNIGPPFDLKEIDYREVNPGSYGAEFGDRAYGAFNIVPRSGFERNNEAELLLRAKLSGNAVNRSFNGLARDQFLQALHP